MQYHRADFQQTKRRLKQKNRKTENDQSVIFENQKNQSSINKNRAKSIRTSNPKFLLWLRFPHWQLTPN